MPDQIDVAIDRVLKGLKDYSPAPLLDDVNHLLRRSGESLSEDDLVSLLIPDDANAPLRQAFHFLLMRWDSDNNPDWGVDEAGLMTRPGSPERRALIMEQLELSLASAERITRTIPPRGTGDVVISAEDVEPWYTPERAASRNFYWAHYRDMLQDNGFSVEALTGIDTSTTEIVSRLADPSRREVYQSKGLVVGRVQSGKTANFTGLIAKAMDAGYRLIIVLTGTLEILRSQTQRRLDMELIGEENILGGADRDNPDQLADVDYAGSGTPDQDWVDGNFLRLGIRPASAGYPDIHRLTSANFDYKRLAQGLATLDFRSRNELKDPNQPVWHPTNLASTDVRIAVIKKNSTVLRRLIDDLTRIRADLSEIPALIVDDEADQASVNTKRQKGGREDVERTKINERLSELLAMLPRAQYVGYTATPFANVFVDPDDSADIFPKDFILSLEAPDGYMGGKAFHDLHLSPGDPKTAKNSGERAFVRDLRADPDDDDARRAEMLQALDSFVLSGAIKLWRTDRKSPPRGKHHTMLIHETVKQEDHEELARFVESVWDRAGYSQPAGLRRLHDLWQEDFLPVMRARASGLPIAEDFKELIPHIGDAVNRIKEGHKPIVVVNGSDEKEYKRDEINFQSTAVWKILIGGAKLSRGYTVEGLTVSFYTRRTMAADTLMQMGRWFGFRQGYHDIVRLFVGREIPGPRGTTVDLYEAFEAGVRDEEDFREELRTYQGVDEDGRPRVTPSEIPPLVYQSLPWLKPTAANKMYNAVLDQKGEGGRVKDFSQQPPHSKQVNRTHFDAVRPLLDAIAATDEFVTDNATLFRSQWGIVDADTVYDVLDRFQWAVGFDFEPTQRFMSAAAQRGDLTDWVVLIPELASGPVRTVEGTGYQIPVIVRKRRAERNNAFSGSSPRQRLAMEVISGGIDLTALEQGNSRGDRSQQIAEALRQHPTASRLHTPTRGALLLTFAADTANSGGLVAGELPDPVPSTHLASIFSLAFPKLSAPSGRIGYTVRVSGGPPIVDSSGTASH